MGAGEEDELVVMERVDAGWAEVEEPEAPVAAVTAAWAQVAEDKVASVVKATQPRRRSRSDLGTRPHCMSRPSLCWRTSCMSERKGGRRGCG